MNSKPGSSSHFVVTLILFSDDEEAEACDRAIASLRAACKLSDKHEFHFNKCSDDLRKKFLTQVRPFKFQYFSIVLNKAALYSEGFYHPDSFYKFTTRLVFSSAREFLIDARVIIDKCGDRRFKQQLQTYLKKHMNHDAEDGLVIRKVKMEDSKRNNLLQLADMVCGAVARSFREERENGWEFRRLVREREMRVQYWPKNKPADLSL